MDNLRKGPTYLILAHIDPEQLNRLVMALNEDSSIFIHVDAQSDIRPFIEFDYPDRVEFIEERMRVSWAGINMVKATLNLIQSALRKGSDYSHLVLLSGLDFPIKPVSLVKDVLNNNPTKEFIRFINVNDSPEHYLKMYRSLSFKNPFFPIVPIPYLDQGVEFLDKSIRKTLGILARPYKKTPLKDITPCFGSQWWAITPSCAQYILDYVKEHPEFFQYFKTAFSPDEYFFHTIIGNSPFLKNSDGFQKYEGRGTYKMANLHVIHPSLTKIYTIRDFNELKNSDKYFVRKITTRDSQDLVGKIKNKLL